MLLSCPYQRVSPQVILVLKATRPSPSPHASFRTMDINLWGRGCQAPARRGVSCVNSRMNHSHVPHLLTAKILLLALQIFLLFCTCANLQQKIIKCFFAWTICGFGHQTHNQGDRKWGGWQAGELMADLSFQCLCSRKQSFFSEEDNNFHLLLTEPWESAQ